MTGMTGSSACEPAKAPYFLPVLDFDRHRYAWIGHSVVLSQIIMTCEAALIGGQQFYPAKAINCL